MFHRIDMHPKVTTKEKSSRCMENGKASGCSNDNAYRTNRHSSPSNRTMNSSNTDSTEKEIYRRIEVQNEPSLMPPYRAPSPTTGAVSAENRRGVLSSSNSTTSSFLEAAATPPPLRAADSSAPGAVCVPGITGSFDDHEHDNLLDAEADDTPGESMALQNRGTSAELLAQPTLSPFYQQNPVGNIHMADLSSMAGPVVAELAPDHSFTEQEVEDRVKERLEARISERLQQEVDRRLSQEVNRRLSQEINRRLSKERERHAVAEVVSPSTTNNVSTGYKVDNKKKDVERGVKDGATQDDDDDEDDDENFKICGIRRTCWGLIFCTILLLIVGGGAGTYLWFDRAREEESNNAIDQDDESDDEYNDVLSLQSSLTPTTTPVPIAAPVGESSVPTESPMPTSLGISPSSTNSSQYPTIAIPSSLTNITVVPTQTPSDSVGPSTGIPLTSNLRWNYLIESMGSYVVSEEFVDNPEAYFVADGTDGFRYAALDWMANIDLETDVFTTPIPLLVERYVVAVLYYSTGTNRVWTRSLSFLTSSTVCGWNSDNGSEREIVDNLAGTEGQNDVTEEVRNDSSMKKGVFCRVDSPYVTSIEMSDNMLQGTIPWELSLLGFLIRIDFDTNRLSGSIPMELSQLTRLRAIWLTNNQLTGEIPRELATATQLGSIDLEQNNLSSTLPSEWGSLSNLNYLSLHLNKLTGTLPLEWQSLTKLQTLDLATNELDGTIPTEYGKLTELEVVFLESNRLEGPLPSTFGKWSNLVNFFVDGNPLTGTVPADYSALTKLEYFWFHGTALTGSVDGTFCDSGLWNVTDMRSNCLREPYGLPAKMECSCCSSCCDSNGENCKSSY
mmetsp:Transcript_19694/g.45825  ORF Transcript_19694/g.45825 Transcript_19694/m.45825 type:complete len:844 (-) Transcript_19694:436-2967(-)